MQQTKNYKLNLIDTSDTFSPAPLNENAQKTETALDALRTADTVLTGAVAAAAAENCLVRLRPTQTVQTDNESVIFDLSGLDLTQYSALLLLAGKPKGATQFEFNGDSNLRCFVNNATAYPCGGVVLLIDSGDGHLIVYPRFLGSESVAHAASVLDVSMAELWKLRIWNTTAAGSHFSLYGIRA